MPLSEHLRKLREEVKSLEKELHSLEDPEGTREYWVSRVEILSSKVSKKGKELLEDARKKLGECEENIKSVKNELSSKNEEINRLENDPTDHIEEQAEQMVRAYYEYVRRNYDKLAYDIETIFCIDDCDPNHLDYNFLPKSITICTKNHKVIAEEDDRYFSEELTGYVEERSFGMTLEPTDWYKEFLEKFYDALKKKLVDNNPFHETFKITFSEDYKFTLELR